MIGAPTYIKVAMHIIDISSISESQMVSINLIIDSIIISRFG